MEAPLVVGLSDVWRVTELGFRIISLLSREAHVRSSGKAIVEMLYVSDFSQTCGKRKNIKCIVSTPEIVVMFYSLHSVSVF